MHLWKTFKSDCRMLREGTPGRRFRHYVTERRKRRGTAFGPSRTAHVVVGSLLIVTGLGIGWLPGPGGFIAIIGLALLAQEIPWIADLLDRIELVARKCLRSIARLFGWQSNATRKPIEGHHTKA